MNLKSTRKKSISAQVGVVAAVVVVALTGFGGSAAAVPSDQVTQFDPTLAPGAGDRLLGHYRRRNGPAAEGGGSRGQGEDYADRVVLRALPGGDPVEESRQRRHRRTIPESRRQRLIQTGPDGVITGMGLGPGVGRVEATIVATADLYPNHPELEQLSGMAWFILNP